MGLPTEELAVRSTAPATLLVRACRPGWRVLFQNATARQFHAFQDVLNQVRLVLDPLLQMRSAEELLELRTQLKGAFDFGLRAETKAALESLTSWY